MLTRNNQHELKAGRAACAAFSNRSSGYVRYRTYLADGALALIARSR
jgi:hypothetical protein